MQKRMDWHRNVKNLPNIRTSQKGNYTITCHFDWLCLRVPVGGPTGHLARLTLVEHFKFFGEKIGEKCPFFFTHFSLKKWVKNSKLFQHFFE
jgi:hypothetical protein